MYSDSVPRGAGYAACCVLAATAPSILAAHLTRGRPWLRLAATAAAAWTVTGAASLTSEAERIRQALQAGDLDAARAALPSLCGRDPRGLDEKELARAVVESVAENTSDGVVGPLLWGAAARLTGVLAGALAPVAGGRPSLSWRAMRRYGPRHPSPNAGRCEAAFAGALGIRLGGTNAYSGVAEERPWLGDGRAPEPADIARAVRLCRAITAAAAIGAAAAVMITGRAARAIGEEAR